MKSKVMQVPASITKTSALGNVSVAPIANAILSAPIFNLSYLLLTGIGVEEFKIIVYSLFEKESKIVFD